MIEEERKYGTGETPGSSGQTALAVGVGAAVGTGLVILGGPVVLPLVGASALVTAISPAIGAAVGSWLGWHIGGKT